MPYKPTPSTVVQLLIYTWFKSDLWSWIIDRLLDFILCLLADSFTVADQDRTPFKVRHEGQQAVNFRWVYTNNSCLSIIHQGSLCLCKSKCSSPWQQFAEFSRWSEVLGLSLEQFVYLCGHLWPDTHFWIHTCSISLHICSTSAASNFEGMLLSVDSGQCFYFCCMIKVCFCLCCVGKGCGCVFHFVTALLFKSTDCIGAGQTLEGALVS